MEIEKQVCSLELAKKLKELGVKQKSLFYWCEYKDEFAIPITTKPSVIYGERKWKKEFLISAFTVAELGEMLPSKILVEGEKFTLLIEKWHEKQRWHINYEVRDDKLLTELFWYKTEAEGRAWILIYLIVNDLLVPPQT